MEPRIIQMIVTILFAVAGGVWFLYLLALAFRDTPLSTETPPGWGEEDTAKKIKKTIFHHCSLAQEYVQEHIEMDESYTRSYECGECSELLLLSTDGKVVNMDWSEIGRWKEGFGEYRRISTQEPLRFVRKRKGVLE